MILQGGEGVYVPMGIFPNINMHKNIDCHLKNIISPYTILYNSQ